MRAKDVMSTDVVTILANATVYDAGELLLSEHVSAMPVIGDTGEIVGIISEADLIRRAEIGTEPHKSWLLRLLADDFTKAAQYVHSHSRHVRDVMTRPVITVTEDATLGEIAQLMVKHDIKRVPVTRENFVVGIVSRANLVQALMSREPDSHSAHPANQQLRKDVLKAVEKQPWSSAWADQCVRERRRRPSLGARAERGRAQGLSRRRGERPRREVGQEPPAHGAALGAYQRVMP